MICEFLLPWKTPAGECKRQTGCDMWINSVPFSISRHPCQSFIQTLRGIFIDIHPITITFEK